MYVITINGKTNYAAELRYARQIKGKWLSTSKEEAQALFHAGQLCNLRELPKIEGLPFATIKEIDAGEIVAGLLNRLQNVIEKLEETQEAMCDFNLENDTSTTDLQEALCDLSMEV